MRNFVSFLILMAALSAGACNRSPNGPSPIPDPTPNPTPRPVPDEAYEGRVPFIGTTVFVPIPYTSEFLEWQIIATKPASGGTYTSDGQILISARCVDKANLVKNIYVEVSAVNDWGERGKIASGLSFQSKTVCWRGWLDVKPPPPGPPWYLDRYKKIPVIKLKIWVNKNSAPALLPVDLEYEENTGWRRAD